jgi:hypothetical protein
VDPTTTVDPTIADPRKIDLTIQVVVAISARLKAQPRVFQMRSTPSS